MYSFYILQGVCVLGIYLSNLPLPPHPPPKNAFWKEKKSWKPVSQNDSQGIFIVLVEEFCKKQKSIQTELGNTQGLF